MAAPQRWTEVRARAEAAMARPSDGRAAFLDRACGDDADLRADVEAQVHACEGAAQSVFLATPAAAFAAPLFAGLTATDGIEDSGPTAGAGAESGPRVEAALRSALAGRYDVERELARGGMATVYLARDRRHGRPVALKVFDPALGAAMSAERFLHEIRVTAGLTHPHILPLHDSGEAAGFLYYVMPYVDGETLRDRLAYGPALAPDAVLRLVREVASALAYAHRHGVVHRDIKPANILLEDGHAVVADFGIARAVRRAQEPQASNTAVRYAGGYAEDGGGAGTLTDAGTSPGTPAYMAPEQAVGGAASDHRADLYALGVVAYEALAGAHPFGAREPQALAAAHRTEAPAPLAGRRPGVPPALAELVMRALEKDPAARPQSAAEIVAALDVVRPNALIVDTEIPRRRPTWKSAGLVGAVVALLAAGGALAFGARSGRHEALATRAGASDTRGPPAIRTVAVLPFVNIGGTATDDYFSDGLTDELAHALARLPGLRLAGRTSSYTFKGKAVAAQEIGRALDVGALVGGTVQRAGDRLRVTTQLVSTIDGKVLWDSVYESRSSDVFSVQDEFTRAIVAALAPSLGERVGTSAATAGRGTTDQEAYDLYLKGRYHWLQRSTANVTRSIAYFRQSVARDPAFARAHAGLAMAYSVLPDFLPGSADSTTALTEESASRAVTLDSTLADAQLALGVALELQLRFRDALAHYRTAITLDPSSVTAHHWLGMSLLNLGRTDEALVELRRATQLDPLATSPASAFSTGLLYARRFPEAQAAARRALALDSTFWFGNYTLGLAQAFNGQPDSAVHTLERGTRLTPGGPGHYSALLFAYAAAGRWSDAERIRTQLRRPGGDPSGGHEAAVAELVFGNHEPLVRLLTTETGQRRYFAVGLNFGCDPLLDPLWADARFRVAMHALAVQACPLARPWPIPPRHGS